MLAIATICTSAKRPALMTYGMDDTSHLERSSPRTVTRKNDCTGEAPKVPAKQSWAKSDPKVKKRDVSAKVTSESEVVKENLGRKKAIPKSVRDEVWRRFGGGTSTTSVCQVCEISTISYLCGSGSKAVLGQCPVALSGRNRRRGKPPSDMCKL